MADKGIKRVVIKNSELPSVNLDTEKYVVRYRIVSEDRNRFSHWSPQHLIDPLPVTVEEDDGISVVQTGTFLTVTWDESAYDRYDVFVAWGSSPGSVGQYSYFTTVGGQFVVIPIRTGETTTTAKVLVQRIVQPKTIIDSMVIAESSVVNLT